MVSFFQQKGKSTWRFDELHAMKEATIGLMKENLVDLTVTLQMKKNQLKSDPINISSKKIWRKGYFLTDSLQII